MKTGAAAENLWVILVGLAVLLAHASASNAQLEPLPAVAQPAPKLLSPLGHQNYVRALVVSPDGRLLLSGSDDSTALLWDLDTARLVERYAGHRDKVTSVAFSPDQRHVITGSLDRTIRLWDLKSGIELKQFKIQLSRLGGGTPRILAVAFSPDGRFILCGTSAGMLLLEADTGRVIEHYGPRGIKMLRTDINAVAFSRDGQLVAAGYWGGIYVWETLSGNQRQHIQLTSQFSSGPKRDITSLTFTADGAHIAAGSVDATVGVWNVHSGNAVHRMAGHTKAVRSIALSDDGRYLLSGSDDATLRLWDMASGKEHRKFEAGKDIVKAVAFSRNNGLVLGGLFALTAAWSTQTGQLAKLLIGQISSRSGELVVSRDGRYLLSGTSKGDIQVWDLSTGYQRARLVGHSSWIESIDISADSRHVVSAAADKSIRLWDLTTGQEIGKVENFAKTISAVAISPDNRLVLAASDEGVVVWNIQTRQVIHKLQSKILGLVPMEVAKAKFSPDGKYIAAAFQDPAFGVAVWDAKSGEEVQRLALMDPILGHHGWIRTMAFSHDNRFVFSGSDDHTVRMWDMESGKRLHVFRHDSPVTFVTVSSNGRFLLTASRATIDIWDIDTRQKVRSLSGLSGRVTALSLTPDDRIVVSASEDGTTRFWDMRAKDGREILAYAFINDHDWIAYTPDGLFDGTPGAWRGSAWRFEAQSESAPVEIFFSEFFYPDLVPDVLSGKRPVPARQLAAIDRRQPRVTLDVPGLTYGQESSQREIAVTVNVMPATGGGARDVRLFRNGILVQRWHGDVLEGRASRSLVANVRVVAGKNILTAYAYNSDNIKSEDATFTLTGGVELRRPGTAYIVAIGVDRYNDPAYPTLTYSVQDARDFADALATELPRANAGLQPRVISLLDGEATKSNIVATLQGLGARKSLPHLKGTAKAAAVAPAEPEDVVIVFFSGHGVAQDEEFFLITHKPDVLSTVSVSRPHERNASNVFRDTAISNVELEQLIAEIDAAQILVIIDACNSGQALESEEWRRGPMNVKGLAQLAYEKGVNILVAAQSYQVATAASDVAGGLLTSALVRDSLRSRSADNLPQDGRLDVHEWFDYASQRVPEMHGGIRSRAREVGVKWLERRTGSAASTPVIEHAQDWRVQRPRAFYRRDLSAAGLIIATLPAR